MKLNWGTAIAITLFLFAGLMSFMVYKATQQRFDLVSEDYYAEEIAYQQIIDQKSNALSLKGKAHIKLSKKDVVLQLPEDLEGKLKNLDVHMYFEKDARKDFNWNKAQVSANEFTIPFTTLSPGKWIAKLHLECEGTQYYFEPEITF